MNKLEKVQGKLEELEETIETWEHPTAWEEANHRMLRRMKVQRTQYEKAIEKIKEREQDEQVRKEVSRDSSCWDASGGKGGTIGGC